MRPVSFNEAGRKARQTYRNACSSAELFSDFEAGMPLSVNAPFHHENCRGKRKEVQMRFTVEAVNNDQLQAMRRKRLCHEHHGHIATCMRCKSPFSLNAIVSNALSTHLAHPGQRIIFPEGSNTKRLDHFVYEMGKDYSWYDDEDSDDADSVADRKHSKARLLYFASNALTNVNLDSHSTSCCFKKGSEC